MRRWRAVVVLGVAGGLVTAAPVMAATPVTIAMHGYRFHADYVEVEVGQAITWTNEDTARHDVSTISGPESFASGLLERGGSFTWTPTVAGELQYVCTIHDEMTGAVRVALPPAPPATAPVTSANSASTTTAVVVPRNVITTRPVTTTTRSPSLVLPAGVTAVAVWAALVLLGGGRRRGA